MKYVVLIAVLLLVYAVWRSSQRRSEKNDAQAPPPADAPALPQDMVRCPVCALHLPRAEALIGREGRLYCSQEHRLLAGDVP